MTKVVNPILSLAVVMALALAAVFGAMSLTGTAQAAVDQSAGAELTEREGAPQAAPTGLTAKAVRGTDGDGQSVMLSWNAVGGTAEADYQVRWRQGSDPFTAEGWTIAADSDGQLTLPAAGPPLTATVSGIANDIEYSFQVRAGGASATPSAEAKATPMEAPAPVEDLEIEVSGRDVMLSWDADSDADSWQVLYFTAAEGATTGRVGTNRTVPTATSLPADSDMVFPALPAEGADTLDDDTDDFDALPAINWMSIPNSGPSTSGYTIEDLSSGVVYTFWVRAAAGDVRGDVDDDAADGNVSLVMTAPTGDNALVPDAPMNLRADEDDKKVTLKWDKPDDPGVTGYEYRLKDASSWDILMDDPMTMDVDESEMPMKEITGLTNGQSYTYEVRVVAEGVKSSIEEIMVMPAMPTAASRNDVMFSTDLLPPGQVLEVDLNDYFTDGIGIGKIASFKVMKFGDSVALAGITSDMTETGMFSIIGVREGVSVISIEAMDGYPTDSPMDDNPTDSITIRVGTPTAKVPPVPELMPSIAALSSDPGKTTRYTIMFKANGVVNAGSDELVIELEDFGFPSSMSASDVTIRVHSLGFNEPSNPESVTVAGEELRIVLGDTNPDTDTIEGISMGDNVTVTIAQGAGLSNPTEGESGKYVANVTGGGLKKITTAALNVPLIIELSEEDGGRGDMLTLIGRGFKNGHTMTFWLDRNMNNVPGESTEAVLCSATVSGDDTATCSFEVNNPPFKSGLGVCDGKGPYNCNFINGYDGAGNRGTAISGMGATAKIADSDLVDDQNFELKAAISISPQTGSVGDTIQVQMSDFPADATVTAISIAGFPVSPTGSVNAEGNGSFSFVIPNSVPQGIEKLAVFASNAKKEEADADTKLIIGGPGIRVTPGTVLANQRVSVVASGFTAGARICCVDPDGATNTVHRMPEIKLGNVVVPAERINGGQTVTVDNGGTWSASINLPLVKALTEEGTKELRVTDSRGRVGTAMVTIPARTIEVTPLTGRVGSIAVVRGEGFPSRNDEGDSFGVSIVYQASTGSTTTVSATPDASGRFEVQLRVPTGAAIPSTNTILVKFEAGGQEVPTSITHNVPEGAISLSASSGGPGTVVTISGEGFKTFVPVTSVKVGSIEVTPSPRPSTDPSGMMSFDITIPGLDVGIQTVEVMVGQTTASTGFTVTESGVNPGDITPVVQAVEPLGENIVSAWHFNNDSKVWSFYDPTLMEGNTLTHMITGETYLIRVKSTAEVILNRDTRNLTCVGGNCWNQIVW